ncbi:hypothetical protein ACBI99_00445 [Nonomuraea sp. ATR24]|nr:hypothetical protein [Nonomuraea ceibae]
MTDVLLRDGRPRVLGGPAADPPRDLRPGREAAVHPRRTLVMEDGVVLHN